MNTLLQIDSSARLRGSTSRALTALFADAWRAAHPDGTVEHLDLARAPLPHFQAVAAAADLACDDRDEPALTARLNQGMQQASCVVIGAPMYTYTIPTTLKAWLDRISLLRNFSPAPGQPGPLGAKRVVVVTARGGSYAPGAPKAGSDFQTPLLTAVFASLGLAADLHFVHAEMTQAASDPKLERFVGLQQRLRHEAEARLAALARGLTDPLAPGATLAPPWGTAPGAGEGETMASDLPPPPDARREPGHSREQVHLGKRPPSPPSAGEGDGGAKAADAAREHSAEPQADGTPHAAPPRR